MDETHRRGNLMGVAAVELRRRRLRLELESREYPFESYCTAKATHPIPARSKGLISVNIGHTGVPLRCDLCPGPPRFGSVVLAGLAARISTYVADGSHPAGPK